MHHFPISFTSELVTRATTVTFILLVLTAFSGYYASHKGSSSWWHETYRRLSYGALVFTVFVTEMLVHGRYHRNPMFYVHETLVALFILCLGYQIFGTNPKKRTQQHFLNGIIVVLLFGALLATGEILIHQNHFPPRIMTVWITLQ